MAEERVKALVEDPAMYQMKELSQSGTAISYSSIGDEQGSPVVYFPGMGGSRYNGLLWLEALKALKLRLITIDRPGRGKTTSIDPKDLNIADCVVELMDCLGIGRAGVMGHSAGCLFAAAFAIKAPQRLEGRLVLLAPWCPPTSPATGWRGTIMGIIPGAVVSFMWGMMAKNIGETTLGGLEDEFGRRVKAGMSEEERARVNSDEGKEIMKQSMAVTLKEGAEKAMLNDMLFGLEKHRPSDVRYPDVVSPTVIYHGTKDSTVPLACATWMEEHMPHYVLVIKPDASHNFIMDEVFMSKTVLPSLLVK